MTNALKKIAFMKIGDGTYVLREPVTTKYVQTECLLISWLKEKAEVRLSKKRPLRSLLCPDGYSERAILKLREEAVSPIYRGPNYPK